VNRITFQGTCDQASPPEVISAFGQPTRTYVEGPFTYYEYAGRTFDPATRKTDALATITFRDGMAIEFHFSGAKRP
jgi:hypothetical protein